MKDAFIALASVSAVLWTGGLIVLQIRTMGSPPRLRDTLRQEMIALAVRQTKVDETKGAMASIAFSMLAPVFALFLKSPQIRPTVAAFFVLYALITWSFVPAIVRFARSGQWRDAINSIAFLLPTIALLALIIRPRPGTALWASALLLFVGYFLLSDSVGTLGRD